jgi:hypothetical protein
MKWAKKEKRLIGTDLEGSGGNVIVYYPEISPEGPRKTTKTLIIFAVSTEIQTVHLPDTSLGIFCCDQLIHQSI